MSLSVRDVLGKSWPITLQYNVNTLLATGPRSADIPIGSWSILLNENVSSLSLRVSHEQFPTQSVTVALGPKGPSWDNRNFTVTVNGQDVNIALTLCRVRQAPCVTVPKSVVEDPQGSEAKQLDLRQFQRGIWIDPGDPKARYVGVSRIDPTKDSSAKGYPPTQLRTLVDKDETVLKSTTTDGWDRFSFTEATVEPSTQGGFLWVEYGAPDSQQPKPVFLVGLWLPRISGSKPIDVIINQGHSPAASSWIPSADFPSSGGYPYLASEKRNGGFAGFPQIYPYFGRLYLFRTPLFSFLYVQQLVASTKPAVIVMPIFPSASKPSVLFEPFNSRAGLWRLLLEIQQFVYQLGYGEPDFDFETLEGRTAIVDGIERAQNKPTWSESGVAPKLGNIVVCGHSSGMNQVLALLQKSASTGQSIDIGNTSLFPSEFYGAAPDTFDTQWKELWDLDLSFLGFPPGTRKNYIDSALKWMQMGSDRRFRSYHSAKTGGFDEFDTLTSSKQISWKKSPATMTSPDAHDWRSVDGKVTFMHFSDDYLFVKAPPADIFPIFPFTKEPKFWAMAHQFAMILGFGHATKLRLQS